MAASAQTPASNLAPAAMPPPHAALIAPVDDEMIDGIKLTDATIDHVLMLLEDWTGRTILRPQQLPTPTFAINLRQRLPKSEAILALETMLNLNGIGVVPVGDKFLKVVDLPRMRMEAPQMIEGSTLDLPPSGQIASKLFQLQFQRVNEFLPQINMLLNGNIGGYVVFEKSNAALITDSISNLQRIETLIKKLDEPLTAGLTPKFYAVHYAKASDIAAKITSLIQGPLQGQLGTATHFSADDRTNQIVLLADPRQYPFFTDLIEKLDVQSDPNTRNEVIYLKHAAAKDVATLLSNLISSQNKANQSGNAHPQLPNQPPGGPGTPANPGGAAMSSLTDLGAGSEEFNGAVNIQPDERSNAVVVSGTVNDIRLIKELVEKVDILLAQVRIEVVIAEVTLSANESSGINSLGLTITGSHLSSIVPNVAGLNGGTDSGGNALPITATLNPAVAAGTPFVATTATGGHPLSLAAYLQPLASRSNVEFLSEPTIVTTHNKEATIEITQNQPIISSIEQAAGVVAGTTTATAAQNPFNTSSSVTYKDIGIILKVKPLIGLDNNIQLQIDQTVDDVVNNVMINGNQQPIIGHREATSFVNVSSDQMIVLGGLQRNRKLVTKGRFGFIYEIPILGGLLGPKTVTVDRTELLVFIRPHVIKPDENVADTNLQINQQSEKNVIKAFIDPATRADPQKAAKEQDKKDKEEKEKAAKAAKAAKAGHPTDPATDAATDADAVQMQRPH